MPEIKILSEKSLAMLEVKEILSKKRKELSEKGTKTLNYIEAVQQKKDKKAKEAIEKIISLSIQRLKEKQIKKIVDIAPSDIDSLRTILSGEGTTLKQEDLQKILEALKAD
ncbi:MAG: hypothetical protein AB1571_00195 [Nanoarchaeota archaeon]